MRVVSVLVWLLPLWALAVGCSGVEERTTVSAVIRVVDSQGQDVHLPPLDDLHPDLSPLEGVEVCETETTHCAVTGTNGEATLELPINEEVSSTLTKARYVPTLLTEVTDRRYVSSPNGYSPRVTMWTEERRSNWFEHLLSPYPQRGTGTIYVFTLPAIEGATFELIGATGKAFYEAALDDPRLDLEAATSIGTGGFVEVGPGEFEIEVGGAAARCNPYRAWPGDGQNRVRTLVRAGHFTVVGFACSN
jgi:hypothetical protein